MKSTSNKKSLKDMTTQEIQEKITRKEKENRYKELYPETVSKGRKFMDSFKKDVLFPGLKEGGKQITTQIVKNIGNSVLERTTKSTTKKKTK